MKYAFSVFICFLITIQTVFSQGFICDTAIPVQCGTVILGDSIFGGASNANNVNNYGCLNALYGSGSNGPERIYKITVTQAATYRFVLDILNGGDLDIIVVQASDPATCAFTGTFCRESGFSYEYNATYGVYREVVDVRLLASPFPYYIFVDSKEAPQPGNKWRFNFSVDCTCRCVEASNDQPTGETLFCDDFENYVANKSLEPQSMRWEQRDSSLTDGKVVTDGFIGRGARFQGATGAVPDEFFLLRDRYSTSTTAGQNAGRYRMSWKMRVEYGKKGYFAIAHQSPVGGSPSNYNIGSHVTFLENGIGELRAGSINSAPIASFPYPQGTWINVVQIVDIEANRAELWINNNFVKAWNFNLGDNGLSSRLAAINFKAPNGYDYKVDEICVWRATPPCTPPPGNPILVENGVQYSSEAAARCALYTSLEWGSGLSLCAYGGTFIHRGDHYQGDIDVSDFAPDLLRLDACVQQAYNNNVPFPLYADIYIFYKDDDQAMNIALDFDSLANPTMHHFVFSCNYRDAGGQCFREQKCLTETITGSGQYRPFTCDSFYYVVITSAETNDNYDLAIFPTGPCGVSFTDINIGCNGASGAAYDRQVLAGQQVSAVSQFDADGPNSTYSNCYNGNRDYTGGEKIYRFVLESPALMTFSLKGTSPMGMVLYPFICAQECIAVEETRDNDSCQLKQKLFEGTYYLIVDKSVNDPLSTFNLTIECEKKSVFEVLFDVNCDEKPGEEAPEILGKVPSACNCMGPAITLLQHAVVINNQNIFANGDLIHFLFRDSFSHYLTSSAMLSKYWDTGNTQSNIFNLDRDFAGPLQGLDTDSIQCAYHQGDTLFIFMTESSKGNHQFREVKATFLPPGVGAATAGNRFSSGDTSIISNIILGDPVTWYADVPVMEAPDKSIIKKLKLHATIPWAVTEVPDAPWLHLSETNGTGLGLYDLEAAFDPNTSMFPQKTTLQFVSSVRPDLYRLEIPVLQFPPCTPPEVEIVPFNNTSFCDGDTIFLRADVGADPVTGMSLAPLYNFTWMDKNDIFIPRDSQPPSPDELMLRRYTTGDYKVSVKVSAKYCVATDNATFPFTVDPPPPAPIRISQPVDTVCTGNGFPTFMVQNPLPGQIIQWYDVPTGGQPIASGVSFKPSEYESKTYYAGTAYDNGLCKSAGRTAFELLVRNKPAIQITDTICSPDHQRYEFKVLTNAGTVILDDSIQLYGNGGVFGVSGVEIHHPTLIRVIDPFCDTTVLLMPPVCICNVETPGFIQDREFCANTPAPSISVAVGQPNVVVNWYASPTPGVGTPLTGSPSNPYQPQAPYLPAYYAEGVNTQNGCISPGRTRVFYTEKPQPTLIPIDTTCTLQQDAYSISIQTDGDNATATLGQKSVAGNTYTFSQIDVNQSVTITTVGNNQCTNTLLINPPNCPCLTVPPPVSNGDQEVCNGGAFDPLSVQVAPGLSAKWYLNGVLEGIGVEFIPQKTGTYEVFTYDPVLDCSSSGKALVTLTELPPITYSFTPPVCAYDRNSYTFSVNAGVGRSVSVNNDLLSGANGIFQSDEIAVGLNADIVITDLNTGCIRDTTIPSPLCPCIETIQAPAGVAANANPVCQGAVKTLQVTVPNPLIVRWYNAQNVLVLDGPASYTPNTQSAGAFTYFAEAYNPVTDCTGPNRTTIAFTVQPSPTVTVSKACDNQTEYSVTATLSNGNTLTAGTGDVSAGPNNTFVIQGIPLGSSTTLTLLNTQTGCSSEFIVNSPVNCDCSLLGAVDPPTAGNNQRACIGQSTFPTLNATVAQPNVVIDWYDAAGASLAVGSNTYTPSSALPAGVYTFYAEARNTLTQCVSNSRTPVQLLVSELPTLTLSTECEPSFLTYKAIGQTDPGNTVTFTAGTLVNLAPGIFEITGITKGSPCTITVENGTTLCQRSETVLLNTCPCPTVNTPSNNGDKAMCQGDPSAPLLSVSISNPATEMVLWFDAPSGGVLLGQGLSYQPAPAPALTSSYFAEARLQNGFCPSPTRREVKLEVKTRPTANAGADQEICEGDTLSLNGFITGGVGGFWSAPGGIFLPNNAALTATQYVPPAGMSSVQLTLVTEDPAGPCPAAADAMDIQLLDAPDISIDSVTCSHDFQTYTVWFHSSTSILNTNLGQTVALPNQRYRMSLIPIHTDLNITGFNLSTSCDTRVTVKAPDPCPCPIIAQPVSALGNFVERCANEGLPLLTVTANPGLVCRWYTDPAGTIPFLTAFQFQPSIPDEFYVEALDTVNGCVSPRTKITVNLRPAPIVFIGPNASFCPGSSVTLTADAGAGYTYHWQNGLTTQSASVSAEGVYYVTVSLAACNAIDSFIVSAYPPLSVQIEQTDTIRCFGFSNGSINAQMVGGTPPVTAYFWSTLSGQPGITGLAAGTYTVTIVDQVGCSATQSYTVGQPAPISLTLTKHPATGNQSDGSISVQANGGIPPYQYQWHRPDTLLTNQNQALLDSIPNGTYYVVVTDKNGCTSTSGNINLGGGVGTYSPGLEGNVEVFPNPNTGRFTVQFHLAQDYSIQLETYDVLGRSVDLRLQPFSMREGAVQVDLSTQPPGLYWLKIQAGDAILIKKVAVNR